MADNGSSRWNGNYGDQEKKRRSLYDVSKQRSPYRDYEQSMKSRSSHSDFGYGGTGPTGKVPTQEE